MKAPKQTRCPAPGCTTKGALAGIKTHCRRYHNKSYDEFLRERQQANQTRAFIKRHFGMTIAEYQAAVLARICDEPGLIYQDEVTDVTTACEICGTEGKVLGFSTYQDGVVVLSLDHDHQTGETRGILCRKCNTGLGQLGDTVEAVQRALDYLRKER